MYMQWNARDVQIKYINVELGLKLVSLWSHQLHHHRLYAIHNHFKIYELLLTHQMKIEIFSVCM